MFPTRFPMAESDDPAVDLSDSLFGSFSGSDSSFFSSPPSSSLSPVSNDPTGLATSFQGPLVLDLEAFGREVLNVQHARPDVFLIRQDFMRNGIDSAFPGHGHGSGSVHRRAPGFVQKPISSPRWPLTSLENVLQPTASSTPGEPTVVAAERSQRRQKDCSDYCVFCYNNGEAQEVYMSHVCRDEQGKVQCPRLRRYVCPYCFATDRNAHTKKYCPNKPIITPEDLLMMPAGAVDEEAEPLPAVKGKSKKSLRF